MPGTDDLDAVVEQDATYCVSCCSASSRSLQRRSAAPHLQVRGRRRRRIRRQYRIRRRCGQRPEWSRHDGDGAERQATDDGPGPPQTVVATMVPARPAPSRPGRAREHRPKEHENYRKKAARKTPALRRGSALNLLQAPPRSSDMRNSCPRGPPSSFRMVVPHTSCLGNEFDSLTRELEACTGRVSASPDFHSPFAGYPLPSLLQRLAPRGGVRSVEDAAGSPAATRPRPRVTLSVNRVAIS
jgi:hypothetical protein